MNPLHTVGFAVMATMVLLLTAVMLIEPASILFRWLSRIRFSPVLYAHLTAVLVALVALASILLLGAVLP